MSNRLREIIKSKIRDSGPLTFSEFMQLALYQPDIGYYSSVNTMIGKEGDFYTGPHVHTAYGSIIGNFINKSFEMIDEEDLSIIELGAGKGLLALDILNHIKREFPKDYRRLNYYIVEQSDRFKNESKKILIEHLDKTKWFSSLNELGDDYVTGVIISNELVDALPFHRVKVTDGNLSEIYVFIEKDEFAEFIAEPSNDDLENYFNTVNNHFQEGQEFEINLQAAKLIETMSRVFKKGLILTIDYGYLETELYNPQRMAGTYKCIYKHTINESPYTHIGEQDITAHVDFSNLIRAGESLGMNRVHYTTQGQFLIDWGVLNIINNSITDKSKKNAPYEKDIQAIKNLILPELMGDKFKVLIQEKNTDIDFNNFYPESPFKISFEVL